MPQQTAIIAPPRQPWYRRLLGSPRHLALMIAGILILGGAAAFGVTELSKDDGGGPAVNRAASSGGGNGEEQPAEENDRPNRPRVVPSSVTVAVLNGTTVPGLAGTVGEEVESHGFDLGTVANTADQEQQRAESVVLYAPGHEREAMAVARRLSIGQRQASDPATQELAGDATVVVIAGADLSQ
jgi:LytR cell envelope-related transcriptional attenuator